MLLFDHSGRLLWQSCLLCIAVGGLLPSPVFGEDYGSVSGQFLYDGEAPAPKILVAESDPTAKDSAVCAAHAIQSEELVIDAETKGIANIFIYLLKAPKSVHPDLKQSKVKEVVFDQKGCRFIPHALFVRTDQEVVVKSNDPIAHNTHTIPIRNTASNFLLQPLNRKGERLSYKAAEFLPIPVKCDIHPWMKANWLILDHPYAAITDSNGRFEIVNLPVGIHSFRVWHERVGWVDRKYEVPVTAGNTTELAPVKVAPAVFEE